MVEISCGCACDFCLSLPPHDHRIRKERPPIEELRRMGQRGETWESYTWVHNDVGKIWVDWKEVAQALCLL